MFLCFQSCWPWLCRCCKTVLLPICVHDLPHRHLKSIPYAWFIQLHLHAILWKYWQCIGCWQKLFTRENEKLSGFLGSTRILPYAQVREGGARAVQKLGCSKCQYSQNGCASCRAKSQDDLPLGMRTAVVSPSMHDINFLQAVLKKHVPDLPIWINFLICILSAIFHDWQDQSRYCLTCKIQKPLMCIRQHCLCMPAGKSQAILSRWQMVAPFGNLNFIPLRHALLDSLLNNFVLCKLNLGTMGLITCVIMRCLFVECFQSAV